MRFSAPELWQALSLTRHHRTLIRWSMLKGSTRSDAGISGAKGRDGRPGLDQMLKDASIFGAPRVVDQHIQATPALVGQIEHTLNVVCTGNVRLDRRLPKLVSNGFCAVTI